MKNKFFFLLSVVMMMVSCTTTSPNVDESEVIENVMMSRRSIRQYADRAVGRDTLERIVRCGINAPNGQNRQAYEIRVVDNPELVAQISDAVVSDNPALASRPGFKNIFVGATCVVFIANDVTYDVSQVDCGLLGENIMLSAWSMGIGTCCMAYPVRLMKESASCAPFIERLGFSAGYNLLYCVAMGYPDESPAAKPRRDDVVRYVE